MGLISEFKEFALKGNMVDLAVGVVIGAAFGTVVKSLVDDVMMPPLGLLMGGVDFADRKVHLKDAVVDAGGHVVKPTVDLMYGRFINNCITFLIVAIAIFIVIKAINAAKRKPQPVSDQPTPLTKEQELLTEIRDALRTRG
jgi:large conductance mechanosensitive channel